MALLHDPPYKPIVILARRTGVSYARLEHLLPEPCAVGHALRSYFEAARGGGGRVHVFYALANVYTLLRLSGSFAAVASAARKLVYVGVRTDSGRVGGSLGGLPSKADGLASGFDRFAAGLADEVYRIYGCGSLKSCVVTGLFNIFNPALGVSAGGRHVWLRAARSAQAGLTCVFREASRVAGCRYRGVAAVRRLYHALYVLLEPLVYEAVWRGAGRFVPLPADTRVPTHSVFDHLYASATAANIVSRTENVCGEDGDSYYTGRPRGILLYVGLGGLREWLGGARKLSDLWVASWLATSIVWYAVRDLVWCLGPDVLLLPDARWNHYYAALLEAKGLAGGEVGGVLRDYYMYRGVPVYAWHPASVVLALPVLRRSGDIDEDGECRVVAEKLSGGAGGDAEPVVAKRIVEYVLGRLREAWRKVVDAVLEGLEEAGFARHEFERVLECIREQPPFTFVVAAVAFGGRTRDPVRFWRVWGLHPGHVEEEELGAFDELVRRFGLCKVAGCDECRQRRFKCYHVGKLVYALAFHELASLASRLLVEAHARPWVDERLSPERPWRHCSVCRVGVAAYRVPGRSLPGDQPSSEYRGWAARVWRPPGGGRDPERAWRVLYPLFRPGERLCPYCLLKRLAGLPDVFKRIAEKLHDVEPNLEVRFPSTSDVAWLSGKLALLHAASLALEACNDNDPEAEGLRRTVTKLGKTTLERVTHRSAKLIDLLSKAARDDITADELKEIVGELIKGFFWTPRLLYHAARLLQRAVFSTRCDDTRLLRGVVAALALAWMETRDIIEMYSEVKDVVTRELPSALREYAEALSRRGESDKARLAHEAATALANPRNYYVVLAFDASGVRWLLEGLVPSKTPNAFYAYLEALARAHIEACHERRSRGTEFLVRYLRALGAIPEAAMQGLVHGDDVLLAGASLGAVPVSPSYHRALANSLTYTLLRLAVVAERLGGIPVYMAGDEGLVLLPGWLPPSLSPYAHRYADEALRALRAKLDGIGAGDAVAGGERLVRMLSWSPFLLYLAVLNRILWGASARRPGFHPVKRGGAGKTHWYIPALVATGLRAGLAVAHYRDHLYAVIEEALVLTDLAGGEGPAAAVYHGRLQPTGPAEPHAEIPLADDAPRLGDSRERLEEVIRSAGWLPALVALYNGAIEEGVLSSGYPHDAANLLPGGLESLLKTAEGAPLAAAALEALLVKRNAARPREAERLAKLIERVTAADPKPAKLLEAYHALLLAARTAAR